MNILLASLTALCIYLIWKMCVIPFYAYYRAVQAFGRQNVHFVYRPLTPIDKQVLQNIKQYGHPFGDQKKIIAENPNLKIIIRQMLMFREIIFVDSDIIKKIAALNSNFYQKTRIGPYCNEITNGLPFQQGEDWKKARKQLGVLFNFQSLANRGTIIQNIINQATQDLDKRQVDSYYLNAKIGGDSVIKSLFGVQFGSIRFGDNTPAQQIGQIFDTYFELMLKPSYLLRYFIFGSVKIDSYFQSNAQKNLLNRWNNFVKICKEYLHTQKRKMENGEKVAPFIEAYYHTKTQYQDLELEMIRQLQVFIAAGQDSTGITLQNSMYYLGQNPQYQEKLRKAINQTQDIHHCKQLNNFINQVLRFYTVLFQNAPRIVIKDFEIQGFKVKAGDLLNIGIGINAHNPKHFDKPHQFNPDRFNTTQNAFLIPFSTGLRNCIGQHMALIEVRLTLQTVLKKYKLVRTDKKYELKSILSVIKSKQTHLINFIKLGQS